MSSTSCSLSFVIVIVLVCLVCSKPWDFRADNFHEILPVNHNLTQFPPGRSGPTWMFIDRYKRGWNFSIYATTMKVWFLKHSLAIPNCTNKWETPKLAPKDRMYENIKQLRRYTAPRNSPITFYDYELETLDPLNEWENFSADSWAVQHQKNFDKYFISDGGVYDSELDKEFYRDPRPEDFGTADYLTRIYTEAKPEDIYGTLWDHPG